MNKTFRMKADAQAWARDAERAIDLNITPSVSRNTSKDKLSSLIQQHIEDLAADAT